MTSLTSTVVVFAILFAGAMVGRAQESTESLFLDTTLFPAVELSIRNTARSVTVSTNPVFSFEEINASEATKVHEQYSSVTETMTASSNDFSTFEIEPSPDSSSHDALIHSNLTPQVRAAGSPSMSASWDTPLMPSFTTTMHSTLHKNAVASLPGISEPSMSIPDSAIVQIDTVSERYITPYLEHSIPNVGSDTTTTVEDSSGSIQLNGGFDDLETSRQTSVSESAVATTVIPDTEFATPTSSWYVFETESLGNHHSMYYSHQFDETAITSTSSNATYNETDDSTSSNATYNETDDSWFKSQVVVSEKPDKNQHNLFAYSKRLGFVLKKRCSEDHELLETFGRLNGQLMEVLNDTIPVSENQSVFICEREFHLTVPLKNMTDDVIKENVKNLTKNLNFGDNFRLEKIYLYQNENTKLVIFSADATDSTAGNFGEYTLSERELIAYIVAGISVATLIFIVLTCCCVRFLCKKQTTSLDLCDIPHLNLKLEDYKLTPIPRPTISFSEYGRELFNPSYSDHTPKLEDTVLNQQHFAAEANSQGARESLSFPREMRTFGGKKPCTRVQSFDARPNPRSGNNWISNSREKLSTDFERRNSGFDNVAFRKWF